MGSNNHQDDNRDVMPKGLFAKKKTESPDAVFFQTTGLAFMMETLGKPVALASGSSSVAPELVASAPPGTLLEMQLLTQAPPWPLEPQSLEVSPALCSNKPPWDSDAHEV